jgi:hypothetical protein
MEAAELVEAAELADLPEVAEHPELQELAEVAEHPELQELAEVAEPAVLAGLLDQAELAASALTELAEAVEHRERAHLELPDLLELAVLAVQVDLAEPQEQMELQA